QEPALEPARMCEADREDQAGDAAQHEADEAFQRGVAGVLRHDPEPELTARALAREIQRNLVEVRELVAREREQELGAFPDCRDGAENRQRPKRLIPTRCEPALTRRAHRRDYTTRPTVPSTCRSGGTRLPQDRPRGQQPDPLTTDPTSPIVVRQPP